MTWDTTDRGVLVRVGLLEPGQLQAIIRACEADAHDQLRILLLDGGFREALEIASPVLGEQVDRFLRGALSRKRTTRTVRSIRAYARRGLTRATPFGTFAGVGVVSRGGVGIERAGVVRNVRPSASWVAEMCQHLLADESALRGLRLITSSALVDLGERMVIQECPGDAVEGHSIRSNLELLRDIAAWCACWQPYASLVHRVVTRAGTTDSVAREFIRDLLGHGFLITDLSAATASSDPYFALTRFVTELLSDPPRENRTWQRASDRLATVTTALSLVDDRRVNDVATYRSLRTELERSFPEVPADLHVDATLSEEIGLELPDVGTVERATNALFACSPARRHPLVAELTGWLARRYGDGQLVRLHDVFLPGSGFDLDSARAATRGREADPDIPPAVDVRRFALPVDHVDIGSIPELRNVRPPWAVGFAHLAACALESASYRLMSAGSGLSLLGRFSQLDGRVAAVGRDFIEAQEAAEPDVLRVEVVNSYQGRAKNIAVRPMMRSVCITLGAPVDGVDIAGHPIRSLPPADILVCQTRGEIRLYSESLGKRLVPSISSAVTSRAATSPMAEFLHVLSAQESRSTTWSWGELSVVPALPRIVVGDVIVARRQWSFRGPIPGSAVAQLPRFVDIGTGDHPRILDLDHSADVETLRRQRVDSATVVREFGDAEVVRCAPPREFVVPISGGGRTHAEDNVAIRMRNRQLHSPTGLGRPRRHGPGSTWASFKIYARDDRLNELIAACAAHAELARAAGVIDRWFYLRYDDSAPHLRLRATGRPRELWGEFAPQLWSLLDAIGGTWSDVVADSYSPEIDRYGGARALSLCEDWFCVDSAYCAQLIGDGMDSLDVTLGNIDTMYQSSGLPSEMVAQLVRQGERAHRDPELVVAAGRDAGVEFRRGLRPARPDAGLEWQIRLRRLLNDLAAEVGMNGPQYRLILTSLVHMHCNRLLLSPSIRSEMFCHSVLRRLYDRQAIHK